MSKVFVHVVVENGQMKVMGNVDSPGRIALMESAKFLLLSEMMKPLRPEGAPNTPAIPDTPSVARVAGFSGRTVA